MPVTNFPNGFLYGVNVRGVPILQLHPGKVFYVNNSSVGNAGSDSQAGNYNKPFATLDYAVGKCTVSRGDIIVLMPGHAENVATATALALDVAGISIMGLGVGTLRPSLTLITNTTATIAVSAANISISNVRIIANKAAIVSAITLTTAKNLTLQDVDFIDTSAILNFNALIDTNTTSNAADGLTLINCNWYGLSAETNTTCILMDGTNRGLEVKGCYFTHAGVADYPGFMKIADGKVVTDAKIIKNIFNFVNVSSATGGVLIVTDGSTNSGVIAENFVKHLDATTEVLVTASSGFVFHDNKASAVADKSGYLLPAADA